MLIVTVVLYLTEKTSVEISTTMELNSSGCKRGVLTQESKLPKKIFK